MIFKSPIKRKSSVLAGFRKDESGAALAEYAILVALISVAAITTISLVGGQVNTIFGRIQAQLATAITASAPPAAPGGGGGGTN